MEGDNSKKAEIDDLMFVDDDQMDLLADQLMGEITNDLKSLKLEQLQTYLMSLLGKKKDLEEQLEKETKKSTLEDVVKLIKEKPDVKVCVMAGAGISTAAKIPDFRTPGTGLYDNLQKYNLPYPEAIFEIAFLRQNPEPFFRLALEMFPGKWAPTRCHYFLKLLEEKKVLHRHYTQNIDTLERVAGMNPDLIVEAHGSFGEACCIDCNKEYSSDYVKECITGEEFKIPYCDVCKGIIKPKITFFGESLPKRFFETASDLKEADVLLVLGTSLTVHPFASLVDKVGSDTPRVLINRDPVGCFKYNQPRDILMLGDCDSGVDTICEMLGWKEELDQLEKKGREEIEAKQNAEKVN